MSFTVRSCSGIGCKTSVVFGVMLSSLIMLFIFSPYFLSVAFSCCCTPRISSAEQPSCSAMFRKISADGGRKPFSIWLTILSEIPRAFASCTCVSSCRIRVFLKLSAISIQSSFLFFIALTGSGSGYAPDGRWWAAAELHRTARQRKRNRQCSLTETAVTELHRALSRGFISRLDN